MISPVALNALYVILGASGNTGSIIANTLLLKGEKGRVIGRDPGNPCGGNPCGRKTGFPPTSHTH